MVTCYDPDAPTPSGFWHWLAIDIPAGVTIARRQARAPPTTRFRAVRFHLRNDMGHASYDGAAPPEGDEPHRYYYVVHAVGEEHLGVDSDASPAVASFNLAFKTLGRAILVGTHRA